MPAYNHELSDIKKLGEASQRGDASQNEVGTPAPLRDTISLLQNIFPSTPNPKPSKLDKNGEPLASEIARFRQKSRKADEVRHHAAEAVWLRYAPQRPPPLNHPSGFAANVTKPHAEHQSRSGRPLRDELRTCGEHHPLFDVLACIGNPSDAPLSDNGK